MRFLQTILHPVYLSDTFNGLMAIPNLIGVLSLSPIVMKITRNYVARMLKKENVKPMLSAFPDIEETHAAELKEMYRDK